MTSNNNITSQKLFDLSMECNERKYEKEYIDNIKKYRLKNLKDCHINCYEKCMKQDEIDRKDTISNRPQNTIIDIETFMNLGPIKRRYNIFQIYEMIKFYDDKLIKDFDYRNKDDKEFPKPVDYFKKQKEQKEEKVENKSKKSKTKSKTKSKKKEKVVENNNEKNEEVIENSDSNSSDTDNDDDNVVNVEGYNPNSNNDNNDNNDSDIKIDEGYEKLMKTALNEKFYRKLKTYSCKILKHILVNNLKQECFKDYPIVLGKNSNKNLYIKLILCVLDKFFYKYYPNRELLTEYFLKYDDEVDENIRINRNGNGLGRLHNKIKIYDFNYMNIDKLDIISDIGIVIYKKIKIDN
jgi:hypothetical protein